MDNLGSVLSVLADPTRLRILCLLLDRDLCVGALARELAISEPGVSQHLKKLRQGGLITGEKRGYWVHYSVNSEILVRTSDALQELASRRRLGDGGCSKMSGNGCCCSTRKDGALLDDFRKTGERKGDA
jgi:ArsR family transcriptional regulator, arsenate/arsenite/antimonite-responsive transcriptional repressor